MKMGNPCIVIGLVVIRVNVVKLVATSLKRFAARQIVAANWRFQSMCHRVDCIGLIG